VGRGDPEEVSVGIGVRLLRGGLRWPVGEMRVLLRFGPQRDPQYGTVTVSHGTVLAATPGEQAVAVASGRVVVRPVFKGYGNLVIVQIRARSTRSTPSLLVCLFARVNGSESETL